MRTVILPPVPLGTGRAAGHVMEASSCGALSHPSRIQHQRSVSSDKSQSSEVATWNITNPILSELGQGSIQSADMLFHNRVFLFRSQTAALTLLSLACQMLQIQGKCGVPFSLHRTYSWPAGDLLFGLTLNLDFSSNSSTLMTKHEVKNSLLPAQVMLEIQSDTLTLKWSGLETARVIITGACIIINEGWCFSKAFWGDTLDWFWLSWLSYKGLILLIKCRVYFLFFVCLFLAFHILQCVCFIFFMYC